MLHFVTDYTLWGKKNPTTHWRHHPWPPHDYPWKMKQAFICKMYKWLDNSIQFLDLDRTVIMAATNGGLQSARGGVVINDTGRAKLLVSNYLRCEGTRGRK